MTMLTEQELQARVRLLAPGIVLMLELPTPSVTSAQQMFECVRGLFGAAHAPYLIVDLTQAGIPNAELRAQIAFEVNRIAELQVGVVLGHNPILRASAVRHREPPL